MADTFRDPRVLAEAHSAGYMARAHDLPKSRNPFKDTDLVLAKHWNIGWSMASTEKRHFRKVRYA